MQVGKQIQHYRKEKNLSQDELAAIIFVSRQSISNWERGATYPDIQNLLLALHPNNGTREKTSYATSFLYSTGDWSFNLC